MSTRRDNQTTALDVGVWGWISYDFVNSLLIINGSLYFSAWITQEQRVDQIWYGLAYVLSTVALLVVLPVKGAILDRDRNGREILLVLSVIVGVAAFCLPGVARQQDYVLRVVGALLIFGIINFAYQASLVSYNWTLVHLRALKGNEDVRRLSGLGEAAGSIGSVVGAGLGIGLLHVALASSPVAIWRISGLSDRVSIFLPLSLIFLVLVLITFWALRKGYHVEPNRSVSPKSMRALIGEGISVVRQQPQLKRFLIAFFFFADGLLTVQLYLPIYMRDRLNFSDSMTAGMVALALTSGAVGASLYARFGRYRDTRRVLLRTLVLWMITLVAFGFLTSQLAFGALVIWCGLLYGVVWSSARAYLIELTPKEVLGRTFAFYAIFDRSASLLGPLLWGAILLLPAVERSTQYIFAFVGMAVMVLVGIIFLARPPQGKSSEP